MATTLDSDDDRAPPRQALPHRLAEVLLIFLVFFTVAGNPPPDVNEPHYLCRLKHFWNPAWCVGDLFLDSTDTQVVFIWTFGWITRWLSLVATAWVGRLLAWALLAWAWQRLSWRLVPRPLAAVLSAALFVTLNSYAHLAGEWVVGGVEAKCFAYGFVLLALGELVDRRWNRVWLYLGAATAFHPLVGGWSAVVCVGVWVLNNVKKGDRSIFDWRGQCAAMRSVKNGPVRLCRKPPVGGLSEADDVLHFRAKSASETPPTTKYQGFLQSRPVPFFGLLAGGVLGLLGVVPAMMLMWNVPAEIVAEASRIYVFDRLPHHLALLTLPGQEIVLRLGRHAALLAALWLLIRALRTSCATGSASAVKDSTVQQLGTLAEPVAPIRHIAQFAWGAALLAVAGLIIEVALWNEPLVAARLLRYYWFRSTDFAAPMAVALSATALIAAGIERRKTWAAWGLTAALVLAGWHVSNSARLRVLNPVPPAEAKMRDDAAWLEVCEWVAEKTPADALFLTPRLNQTFKWRTGRPEVVNRKDIPQDARSIIEWHRRIKDIYYTEIGGIEEPLDSIGILGTERVRELALMYGADYVLMDRGQLLSLPREFLNEEYVVYRIDKRNASDGQ